MIMEWNVFCILPLNFPIINMFYTIHLLWLIKQFFFLSLFLFPLDTGYCSVAQFRFEPVILFFYLPSVGVKMWPIHCPTLIFSQELKCEAVILLFSILPGIPWCIQLLNLLRGLWSVTLCENIFVWGGLQCFLIYFRSTLHPGRLLEFEVFLMHA